MSIYFPLEEATVDANIFVPRLFKREIRKLHEGRAGGETSLNKEQADEGQSGRVGS